MIKYGSIIILFLWISGLTTTRAQLSGSMLSEYQIGNIPDVQPDDLSTLYNQVNLQYRYKKIKVTSRFEQFYSTDSINRNYAQLSQLSLRYNTDHLKVTVGNFYETLGRGLLLRSFEIPSAMLEFPNDRVRYGFYRDLQGALVRIEYPHFNLKLLHGRPLMNTLSPKAEDRRDEIVEAIQPEFKFLNQKLGFTAMRHNRFGENTYYGGLYLQGNLFFNFSYYGEYVRNFSLNDNPFLFKKQHGYGYYFSLSHSAGNYGSSLELKNFHNMLIGSGISDPPTLIKEHSYRLLNRSTHVTELADETGYQLEVYYQFEKGQLLTFNHSLARNNIFISNLFYELFSELYWPFADGSSFKWFLDYSSDDLFLIKHRYATGLYTIKTLPGRYSISLDGEIQFGERKFGLSKNYYNTYVGISLSKSSKASVSIQHEYTTDVFIADRVNTSKIESKRYFFSVSGSYRPNYKNTLILFAGSRQGGPACMSGICYEVLDFTGLELRWQLKL